jgi:hypothetical protein
MAEQSGERPAAAEIGAELIGIMLPDADLELVQLILSRARSVAGDGADRGVGRGNDPHGALLQEYAELIALIRDGGIDRARLRGILGLNPETQSADRGSPHPPAR